VNLAKVLSYVRLRQLNHVLDILLRRAIERKQSHFIRSLFECASLKVVFNLTILTAMLSQELAHLLGKHILRVGIHLAKGNERHVVVGSRTLAFVRRLLILVLVAIIALLVGEGTARIGLSNIVHRRDAA